MVTLRPMGSLSVKAARIFPEARSKRY